METIVETILGAFMILIAIRIYALICISIKDDFDDTEGWW